MKVVARIVAWFTDRATVVRQCSALSSQLQSATENADAAREQLDDLQQQLQVAQQQLAAVRGENEVLKSQLAMYALWEARERERLEAEAAILAARRMVAVGEATGRFATGE